MRDGQISTFLKSLCQDKVTGIILPAPAAAMLGWRAPDTLKDVLQTCRIALIDGPMDLPFAEQIPQAEVDLVTVKWHAVTKQIAADVLSGEAFDGSKTTVFEAEAHLRVPFQRYAQRVCESRVTPSKMRSRARAGRSQRTGALNKL